MRGGDELVLPLRGSTVLISPPLISRVVWELCHIETATLQWFRTTKSCFCHSYSAVIWKTYFTETNFGDHCQLCLWLQQWVGKMYICFELIFWWQFLRDLKPARCTSHSGSTHWRDYSQFPLVEVGCTTSPPTYWWMMGTWPCLTSWSMGRGSVGPRQTMITVEPLTIHRQPAVAWLFSWKVSVQSVHSKAQSTWCFHTAFDGNQLGSFGPYSCIWWNSILCCLKCFLARFACQYTTNCSICRGCFFRGHCGGPVHRRFWHLPPHQQQRRPVRLLRVQDLLAWTNNLTRNVSCEK